MIITTSENIVGRKIGFTQKQHHLATGFFGQLRQDPGGKVRRKKAQDKRHDGSLLLNQQTCRLVRPGIHEILEREHFQTGGVFD